MSLCAELVRLHFQDDQSDEDDATAPGQQDLLGCIETLLASLVAVTHQGGNHGNEDHEQEQDKQDGQRLHCLVTTFLLSMACPPLETRRTAPIYVTFQVTSMLLVCDLYGVYGVYVTCAACMVCM